jgi:hypothetical protein
LGPDSQQRPAIVTKKIIQWGQLFVLRIERFPLAAASRFIDAQPHRTSARAHIAVAVGSIVNVSRAASGQVAQASVRVASLWPFATPKRIARPECFDWIFSVESALFGTATVPPPINDSDDRKSHHDSDGCAARHSEQSEQSEQSKYTYAENPSTKIPSHAENRRMCSGDWAADFDANGNEFNCISNKNISELLVLLPTEEFFRQLFGQLNNVIVFIR